MIKVKLNKAYFKKIRYPIINLSGHFLACLNRVDLNSPKKEKRGNETCLGCIREQRLNMIIDLPTLSLCSPAGNTQENNKAIFVDTEADYTVQCHSFTQTLDKPAMQTNAEKQIMHDSQLWTSVSNITTSALDELQLHGAPFPCQLLQAHYGVCKNNWLHSKFRLQ